MVEDSDLLPAREELGRMMTEVMTISNQDDEGNGDLFPARRKLDMMIKKNKMTDMMRMITMAMKTTMIMTNLLPAGEKLRPDQLGVELLLWRLEGACLVRRMVKISWMIGWSRVLIIFHMTMMTSLVEIISWTQMLTTWSSIRKSKPT